MKGLKSALPHTYIKFVNLGTASNRSSHCMDRRHFHGSFSYPFSVPLICLCTLWASEFVHEASNRWVFLKDILRTWLMTLSCRSRCAFMYPWFRDVSCYYEGYNLLWFPLSNDWLSSFDNFTCSQSACSDWDSRILTDGAENFYLFSTCQPSSSWPTISFQESPPGEFAIVGLTESKLSPSLQCAPRWPTHRNHPHVLPTAMKILCHIWKVCFLLDRSSSPRSFSTKQT